MTDTKDQDATQLQRRARRRLVGAIALVVLAVIVLPIVFDKEPRPISQDLVIQIPSQDAPKFEPRLTPPPALPPADAKAAPAESKAASKAAVEKAPAAPPAKAAESKPAEPAVKEAAKEPAKELAKPAAKEVIKAPVKDAAPAPAKDGKSASESKRAQALLEGSGTWIVPMGSYTSAERIRNLQAKAKAAGYASYTEQIKGPKGEDLIRLRAGPFSAREDADRARDALKSAGLVAGTVAQR